MSPRVLPEWIGSSPEAKVPPRVRLRIFEGHGGICHLSNRRIMPGEPWDLEHIIALCNGGEHRESNMAPALRDKHKDKSRADVAEKSRTYHRRSRHLGIAKAKHPIQGWRKFSGEPVRNPKLARRP